MSDVEQTYYLPYGEDKGYYIDLPCKEPKAMKFYTTCLTGCFIGLKRIHLEGEEFIRVCHWNCQNGFSVEELSRYDFWIAPHAIEGLNSNQVLVYQYFPSRPATLFGIFEDGE